MRRHCDAESWGVVDWMEEGLLVLSWELGGILHRGMVDAALVVVLCETAVLVACCLGLWPGWRLGLLR